jgi:hypothetical protein
MALIAAPPDFSLASAADPIRGKIPVFVRVPLGKQLLSSKVDAVFF